MSKNNKSRAIFGHLLVIAGLFLLLSPVPARADNVIQMNLGEMYRRADKVFRGTVIAAIPSTVRVGGGELPVVTYRIRVDKSFKGDFQVVKGTRLAEVRMFAPDQFGASSSSRTAGFLSGIPRLEVGNRYLLLTTRPSAVGLSAPVGLGQGCFTISGRGGGETAVNAHGNRMLFKGMGDIERQMPAGAQSYKRLSEIIRGLGRGRR